jgi:TPP-dependent 2-oxoacid decarboxylase
LTKPIDSLKKLHKRHELVQSLTTALLKKRADQSKQDVDAKIDWLVSTLDEVLAASDVLEADDATSLFEMLGATRPPKNFLDR